VPLKDDLTAQIKSIFSSRWTSRDGARIPEADDVGLGNDAVKLDAAVLYADLSASTSMVESFKPEVAAEIYKVFLFVAARVVQAEGGQVTAYDGDRIMAVFIGDSKNSSAAKAALKLNWGVKKLVTPELQAAYPDIKAYSVQHTTGIDSGPLWVARTGVRKYNDLVWVGAAANYAAKLSDLPASSPTWITERVYSRLNAESKLSDGKDMWLRDTSVSFPVNVYRSTYWWSIA
jgi:class 3 adenylate cyclase